MNRQEVTNVVLDYFDKPRADGVKGLAVWVDKAQETICLIQPEREKLKPSPDNGGRFPAMPDDWNNPTKANMAVQKYNTFNQAERDSLTAEELNNLACFFLWQSDPDVVKLNEFLNRAKIKAGQSDPTGVAKIIRDNLKEINSCIHLPPGGLLITLKRELLALGQEAIEVFNNDLRINDESLG